MTRFLPIVIILLATCYFLHTASVSAQEITPTVAPVSQVNKQAGENTWESFKNFLIPDTLGKVNCSNLPSEACASMKSGTKNNTLNTQAASNNTDNKEAVGNAAGQYVVASGIHTPPEIAHASTNTIAEFFKGIANAIASFFSQGETQAKNYAGTVLPQEAAGVRSGQSAMDQALPLVECGGLPAGLCTGNKPNSL